MSNLYDRPLPLIPNPQKIELQSGTWKPRATWGMFESSDGESWTYASDERTARRLLRSLPTSKEKRPEAYALRTFEQGAVARACDAAGLRHSRETLKQLKVLASDR